MACQVVFKGPCSHAGSQFLGSGPRHGGPCELIQDALTPSELFSDARDYSSHVLLRKIRNDHLPLKSPSFATIPEMCFLSY